MHLALPPLIPSMIHPYPRNTCADQFERIHERSKKRNLRTAALSYPGVYLGLCETINIPLNTSFDIFFNDILLDAVFNAPLVTPTNNTLTNPLTPYGIYLQVSYLGFCGTMGADYIQYMIADGTVLPKEFRPYYDEKIIAMPHSYFVADHKQSAREVVLGQNMPTRSQYGVPEDKFVFCNFNQVE